MKKNKKKLLIYLTIFVCGVLLGGVTIFFLSSQISRHFISTHTIVTASYNVSKNTALLYKLQSSEIENAKKALESDLDIAIIELHSRLKNNDQILGVYKELIEDKLKYAKSYRLEYPWINTNEKIGKNVEDALADIQIK